MQIGTRCLTDHTCNLLIFFDGIYYSAESKCKSTDEVGTNCDYDFVLVELAHLIYTYRADTELEDDIFKPANPLYVPHPDGPNVKWTYADFLTNDMIYNIICQRKGENQGRHCPGTVRYAFGELSNDRVFKQWVGVTQSETENHVLQILAWDYLATNWVMWQGSLPQGSGSRRRYQPMTNLMNDHWQDWEDNAEFIYKRVLRVLGRVVHSGLFETNSRPYGSHSLSALLALASYGEPWDLGQPPDIPMPGQFVPLDVKQGAINAVNYLATKYAFQSLRGKRQGPMRRGRDYRKHRDFYSNNNFVTTMSLLSGAYEWDDCIEDTTTNNRPDCPRLRWNDGPYTGAFVAMLGASDEVGYQIPEIIHRFMFGRKPFYARMMARYTDEHQPRMGYPKYFDDDTTAFHQGKNKSSPELYFGDGNILLTAGGSHTPYWDLGSGGDARLDKITESNHIWAKPTMLIPRGDFGHYGEGGNEWEWDEGQFLKNTADDVLVSPGKVKNWWRSECNVWLYRNFVYGYRFHDRGRRDRILAPEGFPDEHAFHVPSFWETRALEVRKFEIGWAHFEIYDFKGDDWLVPPSAAREIPNTGFGYYIVRARFRKDKAGYVRYRKHREFARGFVEIIPRRMFSSASLLQAEIEFWNLDGNFSKYRDEPWIYVLTLSKEKVYMDQVMGAGRGGKEVCTTGITGIREFDPILGAWDKWVDRMADFIPRDINDSAAMKQLPLITVWQLNGNYKPTGCKYVETVDEGVIVVRREAEICWDWDHSIYPPACRNTGPGWHCLKIDSHNYTQPDSEVLEFEHAQYDCTCFSP